MARITKDDFNYGAALKQVADDQRFKSINAEWENGSKSRCAFRINTGIGLYIKMGKEPKTKFKHYVFNFKKENLEEIRALRQKCTQGTFIVLVCLKDLQTCVVAAEYLERLIGKRGEGKQGENTQYNLQVNVKGGRGMRVYMNTQNSKKEIVENALIVPRNAFPRVIFE
jgi:hypothetical protein